MKLRLIKDVYEELKNDDPNTAMTLNGLRRIIKSKQVPTVKIGRKTLVNYEVLTKYLSCTSSSYIIEDNIAVTDPIRKIE